VPPTWTPGLMAPPIWADSAVGIMRLAATAPITESLPSIRLALAGAIAATMAATNKCLAHSNKSRAGGKATKKRNHQ
jgi:hypothetical protein